MDPSRIPSRNERSDVTGSAGPPATPVLGCWGGSGERSAPLQIRVSPDHNDFSSFGLGRNPIADCGKTVCFSAREEKACVNMAVLAPYLARFFPGLAGTHYSGVNLQFVVDVSLALGAGKAKSSILAILQAKYKAPKTKYPGFSSFPCSPYMRTLVKTKIRLYCEINKKTFLPDTGLHLASAHSFRPSD